MTAAEAERYHPAQIQTLADTAADLVTAITLTYADEAIGIVACRRRAGLPVVVSFTVETDGRLPSGQTLGAAIEQVDDETDGDPAYYMINCAHPTHFAGVLADGGPLARAASAGCAPTRPRSATPSSTRRGARRRRPGRPRRAPRRAARAAAEPRRARRLLRHRHPRMSRRSPTPGSEA